MCDFQWADDKFPLRWSLQEVGSYIMEVRKDQTHRFRFARTVQKLFRAPPLPRLR